MNEHTPSHKESLSHTLVKKGFWLYFFSYLIGPTNYLVKIILSHSLSVGNLGVLYSIIGFITILTVYNGLGLTESLRYFIPKYYIQQQRNNLKTSLLMSLGIQMFTSLLVILLLWYGADWLAVNYFHSDTAATILKYFCWYFLGVNIFQVMSSVFISFKDTFNYQLTNFLRSFFVLVFTLWYFITGAGNIYTYATSWILGLLCLLVVSAAIYYRKYITTLNKGVFELNNKFLKPYLTYSLWTFFSMNIVLLFAQMDQQMVIYMLGPESAGYFTNYLSLIHISVVLIGPIYALLIPMFSELYEQHEMTKIKLLQNILYTFVSIFTLSLSALFISLGPEISSILFGERFIFSGKLLQLGGTFTTIFILVSINFQLMASMGKVKERTYILGLAVLINFILNIILINAIGTRGAIIGTVIGSLVMFIISLVLIHRVSPIQIDRKLIQKNMCLIIIMGSLIYLYKGEFMTMQNDLRRRNLAAISLIGTAYYLVLLLFNKQLLLQLVHRIKHIVRK